MKKRNLFSVITLSAAATVSVASGQNIQLNPANVVQLPPAPR